MGDRYRYERPRSPVMSNPARASLPINVYATPAHEHHMHVIPTSRREAIANPRSSVSSASSTGPVTTTTYKVTADPLVRARRNSSRVRSSTVDSSERPIVVPTSPRTQRRPVIHSATGGRPMSPLLKNPYRSSEEEYYAVPATSKHGHHHRKGYSATMDNADMHKLRREREGDRLRVGVAREERGYRGTARARPIYPSAAVRHPDTVAADYGDNGYGYTNPRDLVQYDLNQPPAPRHHPRRDSFEGGRAPRPSSITSYQDVASSRNPYDTRERGPPPTVRGFDKIQPRGATWDQPAAARISGAPPPPPMDPIQRPARVEQPSFEVEPPRRRESLTRRPERPVSLYHNDPRRELQRDEYYEARDDGRRDKPYRNDRFEDPLERGYGVRSERPERVERVDRVDRVEKLERSPDDRDKKEFREHKGSKDALASGLSIAGAALGANVLKKVRSNDDRDDRDEREERRRRLHDDDYDDEPRRRRETKDERGSVDLSNRDPRERRHRDSDVLPLPPPPPGPPPAKLEPPIIDLNGRDPKERQNSRDNRSRDEKPRDDRPRDERPRKLREDRTRDSDSDSRERDRDRDRSRRHRSEASVAAVATAATAAAVAGTAIDSRDESSASDDTRSHSRLEPRSRHESTAAPAPFNAKDTMDLKALKEALNKNEHSVPKESVLAQRDPRESFSKDPRELADTRSDLNSNARGREASLPVPNRESRQLRVVSPPREKTEDKPILRTKGILRAPREKFPEDPSPIREGVAPLKDAKKDGVPPDARWTKISRKLVNPAALEAGKERFEEREDFVIVLRVLSRDEVQAYAEVTERIRATREDLEHLERQERRRARRERHERHKRERLERGDRELSRTERSDRHHRRNRDRGSGSETDTTDDSSYEGDSNRERPKMIEPAKPIMSGALGEVPGVGNTLREDPSAPGQYTGYTRNPPPPGTSVASTAGGGGRR